MKKLLIPLILVLTSSVAVIAHNGEKHEKPAAAPKAEETKQKGEKNEHGHSHDPLLPAPKSTLEAVQQVDALHAALQAAVAEKRLVDVHNITEAMAISLSGLGRFGAEGLSEGKAKRLEGLVKNLHDLSEVVHKHADDYNQAETEKSLGQFDKMHALIAVNLPKAAAEAKATPLPDEFLGKVKAE